LLPPGAPRAEIPTREVQSKLYHEKQSLSLCAIHAINNLLQTNHYNKEKFDSIANSFIENQNFFNTNIYSDHKSLLGNYDINVITKALNEVNYDLKWFDSRRKLSELGESSDTIEHLIINIKSRVTFMPFLKNNHWVSVISKNGKFYYIDKIRRS